MSVLSSEEVSVLSSEEVSVLSSEEVSVLSSEEVSVLSSEVSTVVTGTYLDSSKSIFEDVFFNGAYALTSKVLYSILFLKRLFNSKNRLWLLSNKLE
ncbi:hypothetical protein HNP97_000678 [Methanococcus maripaludis]|uniref:Uncharacterized protein n=1 Tax=Methanococcus maripaludis TaxID=39152 RepID=A0A7J9S0X9_METMI|nr:hypothetical protein [Methanococcus maripaludis]